MKTPPATPRIINAERLDGGVIITFNDGKCAVYSASLLHAKLTEATEVDELVADDSEEPGPELRLHQVT